MRSMRLATLLSALLVIGCRHGAVPDSVEDPRVDGDAIVFPAGAPQLATIHVEPVGTCSATSLELFGRLVWNDNATVRVFTPFAGRVRRILVESGRAVTAGTPLAEIESADFAQVQSDDRDAASNLQLAEKNLVRVHELFDHGAAARKDVEAAEAEENRAASQRAREGATLATYEARADSVDGRFLLRSPIAGTVVERNVNPGQEVRPDQMLANTAPIFVVSDPRRLWIELDATESDLMRIAPDQPLVFTSRAFPGRVFHGKVDVVSAAIDPVTRTLKMRGTVENPSGLLKAEMFVTAELASRLPTLSAGVPEEAVLLGGDHHYVFVEEQPHRFVRREVRVESREDRTVLVSNGVRPGERVVTTGAILLQQMLQ